MLEHNVPSFVEITEDEFVALRTRAVDGRCLEVQFNSGKMRLRNNAANHWVFPILAHTRGLTTNGDGN